MDKVTIERAKDIKLHSAALATATMRLGDALTAVIVASRNYDAHQNLLVNQLIEHGEKVPESDAIKAARAAALITQTEYSEARVNAALRATEYFNARSVFDEDIAGNLLGKC